MSKLTFILIGIILIIFAILLYTTAAPKDPTKTLSSEATQFQAINLSPEAATNQQPKTNEQQTEPQPTFGVEAGLKASYAATLKTTKGTIQLTLISKAAPQTVKNFLEKAKSGFYNNLTFHRVEDWVIQGGDPQGDGSGGNFVQTEINDLPFTAGSVGVAGVKNQNGVIISNDAQFFITKTEASWLDQQYTNFGTVTEGMDVVKSIKVGDKILEITIQ